MSETFREFVTRRLDRPAPGQRWDDWFAALADAFIEYVDEVAAQPVVYTHVEHGYGHYEPATPSDMEPASPNVRREGDVCEWFGSTYFPGLMCMYGHESNDAGELSQPTARPQPDGSGNS